MSNQIVAAIDLLLDTLDDSGLSEVYNKIRTRVEPDYEFEESLSIIHPSEIDTASIIYRSYLRGVLHYLYRDAIDAERYFINIVKSVNGFADSDDGITAANLINAVLNFNLIDYDATIAENIWNKGEVRVLNHIRNKMFNLNNIPEK